MSVDILGTSWDQCVSMVRYCFTSTATAVTRGWNGYRNKSQHRKLTLEKKILPPLQQGVNPATFRSRVRRSNHRAIPAPRSIHGIQLLQWHKVPELTAFLPCTSHIPVFLMTLYFHTLCVDKRHTVPRLRNALPLTLRECTFSTTFCKCLKTYVLSGAKLLRQLTNPSLF